ncbi:MAG: helix-turn-helix domain-containing protein [Rikenellaceae bacterium]|nr:helix-turn-helix domain-containing protein [Rikenellaceae bacterium]
MENSKNTNINIDRLRELYPEQTQCHYKGVLIGQYKRQGNIELYHYPCRIEAATFLVCTSGEANLTCNMTEYKVKAGDMLAILPRSIMVSNMQSEDCCCRSMMIDQNFLKECDFNLKRLTQHMMEIAERCVIQLQADEQQQIIQSMDLLQHLINERSTTPLHDEVIRAYTTAHIHLMCDILSSRFENKQSSNALTRQESYFRQFIKELSEHYTERQSVTYYADKLCISARYLTTIVRRVSGLTVTDWMNRYILMEAKYLLKYSDMSIQEVAYKLSFPDQSFFGKYFKQHIGMSPSAYRNQQ